MSFYVSIWSKKIKFFRYNKKIIMVKQEQYMQKLRLGIARFTNTLQEVMHII